MPLGAARITFLAKTQVTAVAEVIRKQQGISAVGNTQVDTAQSEFGGASAYFDGTGDYLLIDSTTNPIDFSGDFTIEAWVNMDTITANQKFFDLRGSGGTPALSDTLLIDYASGFRCFVNGSDRVSGSPTASSDTWYHIAFVRDGNFNQFYVNGTRYANYEDTTPLDYTLDYSWVIGINGDDRSSQPLNGWIDEVRFSDTARYTGTSLTVPTAPFVNDDNTKLLLHMDGTDGSTTFVDDNGTGRAQEGVAALNQAQISTAQSQFSGSSALFDGTGDYLQFNTAEIPAFGTGDFTVEYWFRMDALPSSNYYMPYDQRPNSTNGAYLTIAHTTETPGDVGIFVNSAFRIQTGAILSANTWYHLAVVRSSGTTKLYIDGTQQGSSWTDSTNYLAGRLRLGANFAASNGFDGYIDEVRISDSARYTTSFTPSTTPFVNDSDTLLLLHMDGTNTSTYFEDDNGKGRSRVGVTASGNAQIDTADYQFGGASALFDGTGDYLTLPNQTFTGDFTIEFWAKPDAATDRGNAIRLGHWSGSSWLNDCVIQFRGTSAPSYTSRWYVIFNDGSLGLNVASGGGGSWQHIAVCRSGGTTRLFQDGALLDSVTVGSPSQIGGNTSTDNITIGAAESNGITQYFDGWIDEVRISNTARYTAAFTAPTAAFENDADTTLLLHMNGTDGSTVFTDDNGVY